ncbi:MAG: hypothetical protein LH649_11650 [Pseudanabaena sp. CAN_BIN31]|nr:hypothetical protein [Pseudanabaena sp. CAN_BIN31]
MFKKCQNHINLNIIFTIFIWLCIDISGIIFLTQSQQRVEAQTNIQIRTEQWQKVEEVTGNVRYRNLYNYDNRPAKVGDRLHFNFLKS